MNGDRTAYMEVEAVFSALGGVLPGSDGYFWSIMMIRFERFQILVGILLVFGGVGDAGAVVIQVPGDFGTIQGAIDSAAGSGDEIVVAPGTYGEVINFLGKAIYLHSGSGDAADTVIDGTGLNDSVVLCINGEGAGTILEGFTITGGTGNAIPFPGFTTGGGMLNLNSCPTVASCIFSGNSADSVGGMFNDNSNATVMNCLFIGNAATTSSIGGMGSRASSPRVTNCTFNGNTGGTLAGGLGVWGGGHPMLTNCTFVGNIAKYGGGAIYSSSFNQQVTATNCIFWDNGPDEITHSGNSTIEVSFSVVPFGLYFDFTDGGGNISVNPAFVDANGSDNIPGTLDDDLRLQRFSPCVDAGDNGAVGLENIMTDGEGNPRFIDDAGAVDSGNGKGSIVDIGALERQTDSIQVTFRVPEFYSTIQGAIFASALNGDEIVVAPGIYHEVINYEGKAVHLRSESGNPVDTILDGTGLNDSVVLCINGEGAGTILEGITITGGVGHMSFSSRFGGGIYSLLSSPTVINCIIRGNTAHKGGGMANKGEWPGNGKFSKPTVVNCIFKENSATNWGGGIYNFNRSNPSLINCTFSGNAAHVGAGVFNENSSSPKVINCTFHGNTAGLSTGGMFNFNSCDPVIKNCILRSNPPEEIFNQASTPLVLYSNMQGGLGTGSLDGGGNIDADPLFVDALGPDTIPGTADDDLRLQAGSPCIDAGINNGVIGDLVDLNADGCILERIPLDFDGNPRFADDPATANTGCGVPILGVAAVVDMGAFEFFGTPAPKILVGDTNGNGLINIDDLVDVLNAFGFDSGCSGADVHGDGAVGMMDLLAVLDGFGGCP